MDFPQGPISIEILDIKDSYIRFALNNVDVSFANCLRRVMISEVPTMAVEFVFINNNMSSLHDEFLAQRLGLVPLVSNNVDKYDFFMDCKLCQGGKGCDHCSVSLTLKVSNNNDPVMDVTSLDIRSESPEVKPVRFYSVANKDMDGNPQETGILLAKLSKGQEIDVEMVARKGISRDHFKYCPVAVANFQYEPVIEFNQQMMQNITKEQKITFVKSCPTRVYELTNTDEIVVADHMKCVFCDECVKVADSWKTSLPPVKISQRKYKFIFNVETNGSLRPEDIVRHAFNEMKNKLNVVKESCEAMRNPSHMMSNR